MFHSCHVSWPKGRGFVEFYNPRLASGMEVDWSTMILDRYTNHEVYLPDFPNIFPDFPNMFLDFPNMFPDFSKSFPDFPNIFHIFVPSLLNKSHQIPTCDAAAAQLPASTLRAAARETAAKRSARELAAHWACRTSKNWTIWGRILYIYIYIIL